jgi:hypothetical protein
VPTAGTATTPLPGNPEATGTKRGGRRVSRLAASSRSVSPGSSERDRPSARGVRPTSAAASDRRRERRPRIAIGERPPQRRRHWLSLRTNLRSAGRPVGVQPVRRYGRCARDDDIGAHSLRARPNLIEGAGVTSTGRGFCFVAHAATWPSLPHPVMGRAEQEQRLATLLAAPRRAASRRASLQPESSGD